MSPGADPALTVVTYNIHKGFSALNGRLVVHEIRERLHALAADVVFLQEVQGAHRRHSRHHVTWPEKSQHEFLSHEGGHAAYGLNASYLDGHHGNAIVSRFPIVNWENVDISHHALESRGLLHCEMAVPGWKEPLHCINVHLGLWARSRRFQLEWLCSRIRESVPDRAPLVVAGDFNDWRGTATAMLGRELGLAEVFEQTLGRHAKSFPARLPFLALDRIYVRNLKVGTTQRFAKGPWALLSDHAALAARLTR
ncbi:MAG: endonuclease/exonuclease/phosphatase family protein [Betaproteobacteria bacterium]|nr:endonuclease/exonuclease/phosphatase family protein [Betaproteobacteria bacterium]